MRAPPGLWRLLAPPEGPPSIVTGVEEQGVRVLGNQEESGLGSAALVGGL